MTKLLIDRTVLRPSTLIKIDAVNTFLQSAVTNAVWGTGPVGVDGKVIIDGVTYEIQVRLVTTEDAVSPYRRI
jgi:hypothetical protein